MPIIGASNNNMKLDTTMYIKDVGITSISSIRHIIEVQIPAVV